MSLRDRVVALWQNLSKGSRSQPTRRPTRPQLCVEPLEARLVLDTSAVYGYDLRQLVPVGRTADMPFSAIGKITVRGAGSGTGFMVGRNLFLTAAHVLYARTASGQVVTNARPNDIQIHSSGT